MALSYTTAKSTLDEIAVKITTSERRLARARELMALAESELAAMSTQYGTFASELDTEATTQGTAVWQRAKDEKDEMVGDFQALRTRAADLLAAYDAV